MTEEKKQSLQPTSRALCIIYNYLLERKEVFFELQDEHADNFDVIVKTVFGTYFGFSRFPTNEDKAVALFCLIIKDHPVIDGNKRTAVLALQVFCKANDLTMNTDRLALDILAVSVEQMKGSTNDELFALVKKILFT